MRSECALRLRFVTLRMLPPGGSACTHRATVSQTPTMLAIGALLLVAAVAIAQPDFAEYYMWKSLNFTWPNSPLRNQLYSGYVPENVVPNAIKASRDKLFITLPRWRLGVPATLAFIPSVRRAGETSPLLEPYPSWDMQQLHNCSALQDVHSIEASPQDTLWILDSGSVDTLSSNPDTRCPPKLVLVDLNTNEIISTFAFPEIVLSTTKDSLLSEIVLDDDYAYISDASPTEPGIIVYHNRQVWKIKDNKSMRGNPMFIDVGTRSVELRYNVHALALSPRDKNGDRLLYYSPMNSYELYAIPATVLRGNRPDAYASVKTLGRKVSPVHTMIMDWHANLYFGGLVNDTIFQWNSEEPLTKQVALSKDTERLRWISGLGFDNGGNLWVVSNQWQNLVGGTVNINQHNYRVIKGPLNTRSYLFVDPSWSGNAFMSTTTMHSIIDIHDHHDNHEHRAHASAVSPIASVFTTGILVVMAYVV